MCEGIRKGCLQWLFYSSDSFYRVGTPAESSVYAFRFLFTYACMCEGNERDEVTAFMIPSLM